MQKRIAIAVLIAAGLLAMSLGVYLGLKKQENTAKSTDDSLAFSTQAFFESKLNDVNGQEQSISQWQGRWLLVNFWAPWCAPCVEEMPELESFYQTNKGPQLDFLGIAIDSPDNVRQFNQKVSVSYPILLGGILGTDLARHFGNVAGGLPYTVLIDPAGKVRKAKIGRIHGDLLKEWLTLTVPAKP